MFYNYLKIAIRNLLKKKTFSLINIFGLNLGITAFLLIIAYVRFEISYDSFHKNSNRIFRVTLQEFNDVGEVILEDAEIYPLLGETLKNGDPAVLDFVRMHGEEGAELGVNGTYFKESRTYFADSSLFNIFSYDLLTQTPDIPLNEPNEVVLTKSYAIKYFGRTDVIGESIDFKSGWVNAPLKIVGVMEDVPSNSHIKFNFLLSYETLFAAGFEPNWDGNNEYTYLLMKENTDVNQFNASLKVWYDSLLKDRDAGFIAQSIEDIHLYSNKTYEPEVNGDAKSVYFLLIIGIFVIAIAWINYINLSTARSVERAKEVGVRKVMGAPKKQLIGQFIMESAFINFIAIVISVLLLFLFFPNFIQATGLPIPIDFYTETSFWITVIIIFSLGTLFSGLYPALVLSAFQPISILKGKLKNTTHGIWLRKGLVIFQFAATVVLISGTFTVYNQLQFLQSQDLGMDLEQVLVIELPNGEDSVYKHHVRELTDNLRQQESVIQIATTTEIPGMGYNNLSSSSGIRRLGSDANNTNLTYYIYGVDHEFIPTLKMEMLHGENFTESMISINKGGRDLIINEKSSEMLGFTSPEEAVGSQIRFWGENFTIIGVMENYHHHSPKQAHDPMILYKEGNPDYLLAKLKTQNIQQTIDFIQATAKKVFPESHLAQYFLNDQFELQYRAEQQFGKIFALFALLAIFIASMGLFGLASYTTIQRSKEIGIRKILGASIKTILLLLSKDFLRLILIAFVLAVPITNYFMEEWLNTFAFRIDLSWWLLMIPGMVVVIVAFFAISSQSIKAATGNPVEVLRNE